MSTDGFQTDPLVPMTLGLPQKLHNLIADFVAQLGTKADLRACMLTCRAWLPGARAHLFRSITIKPRTDLFRIYAICTSPELLPYVKAITILGCLNGFGLGDDGTPYHGWLDSVAPLLRRLSTIDTLRLDDLSWGDIRLETRQILLTSFPRVTRLLLYLVDFWNANQLVRTLNAFPCLTELSVGHSSWHLWNHLPRQVAGSAPLSLRSLYIGPTAFGRYAPLLQWLLSNRPSLTVRDAVIWWEDPEISSLVAFLRKAAPSLKSLEYHHFICLPHTWCHQTRPQDEIYHHGMEEDDDRDDGPAYYGEVTVGPRPDPDLELDDDELDGVRNAVSGAGFYAFPPQVQANLDGLSMLEAMPIIGSAVEVLHVYITWTPLALFGIKMMCQMVSTRTKVFHLTLIFKLSKSLVSTKWDRIDSLLAEVQPPEIPGADFRLYLRADWDASPDTLIEATRKYVQQLPQIRECGLFTITSTSGELEDPEAAADEQFWENCQ